jgi:hypothetical protein
VVAIGQWQQSFGRHSAPDVIIHLLLHVNDQLQTSLSLRVCVSAASHARNAPLGLHTAMGTTLQITLIKLNCNCKLAGSAPRSRRCPRRSHCSPTTATSEIQ